MKLQIGITRTAPPQLIEAFRSPDFASRVLGEVMGDVLWETSRLRDKRDVRPINDPAFYQVMEPSLVIPGDGQIGVSAVLKGVLVRDYTMEALNTATLQLTRIVMDTARTSLIGVSEIDYPALHHGVQVTVDIDPTAETGLDEWGLHTGNRILVQTAAYA